jgi:HTH-type transcriptional regulator/antitoxin MqsA
MGKDVRTQPCPECGGLMKYEKHDDVLRYKGQSRTIKTLGWWCTQCGEAILSGEPLVAHERAFQQFKAEVDGVLAPAEVARIRTTLGLSQRRASELLGGGPRAFQKYEAGTQALSVAMSHLLRLLANDPSRLRELSDPTMAKARRGAPARTASPPAKRSRERAIASR